MPSIPLHPPAGHRLAAYPDSSNPLPQLLQTPFGLAILELQGTINMPSTQPSEPLTETHEVSSQQTPIGKLVFPDYSASDTSSNTAWMKRVYLYVGQHQRLTGEVKKLPKPMAVIRRRDTQRDVPMDDGQEKPEVEDELEIVEIVRWKILFSSRPEPVGS